MEVRASGEGTVLLQGIRAVGHAVDRVCKACVQTWQPQAAGSRATEAHQRVRQESPKKQQHTCSGSALVTTLAAACAAAAAASASGAGAAATSNTRELAAFPASPTHPEHSNDVRSALSLHGLYHEAETAHAEAVTRKQNMKHEQ